MKMNLENFDDIDLLSTLKNIYRWGKIDEVFLSSFFFSFSIIGYFIKKIETKLGDESN